MVSGTHSLRTEGLHPQRRVREPAQAGAPITTSLASTTPSATAVGSLTDLVADARRYADHAHAANTRRAYAADWRDFQAWCTGQGVAALPASPATVALYLTAAASERRVATLQRRLAAIRQAHGRAGVPFDGHDPVLRNVWRGIRRTHGTASRGKAAVRTAVLRDMSAALGDTLADVRDRALLVLGFAGALRRSELVGLDVEDVEATSDGLVVTLRRSKVDQEGQGRVLGLPYGSHAGTCPVRTLLAWRECATAAEGPLTAGPLFRPIRHARVLEGRLSDRAVARVVQRAAARVGLDPAQFAGHSLRAGLVTSAAAAGIPERAIMAQTGHARADTLRRYIRTGTLFQENAAAGVGL